MIYQVNETPPVKRLLLFALQMMLSVFVATVLIAKICGVDVSAAMIGAGMSTIVYGIITKKQSPMFISNSGNYVAPVLFAIATAGMTGVIVGGVVTCLVYCLFGIIFTRIDVNHIYKIFPPALIGATTAVIGLNLMSFIPTYIQVNGEANPYGLGVAFLTMVIVAVASHYAKGMTRVLPLLIGTLAGYAVSLAITISGLCPLVDLNAFSNHHLLIMPQFAFMQMEKIAMPAVISIAVMYIAYTVSAMMECMSDHKALSGIIDKDLYQNPGLGRIFIGEGCANLVSSWLGGLGACSYGEGVACVGFSRVASRHVVDIAAVCLIVLGFLGNVQALLDSIPSCVFGGCAMILYGFIASSGIKMLKNVDLNHQKELIIVSVVLSVGVSGITIGASLTGTALALVVGVVLNLLLKENAHE